MNSNASPETHPSANVAQAVTLTNVPSTKQVTPGKSALIISNPTQRKKY